MRIAPMRRLCSPGRGITMLFALLLACCAALAQGITTGPTVGDKIPAFSLPDRAGNVQTFDSLKGENGMVLAFVRSADWCPFCKTQLVDLNSRAAEFAAAGAPVVSISYDTREVLNDFATRQKIAYTMLSDTESKVIRDFGILNTSVAPDDDVYGIPYPGIYVLDRDGVVKAKYFEESFRDRYSAGAILAHEFGGSGHNQSLQSGNSSMDATANASDQVIVPGRRITLIVDVTGKSSKLAADNLRLVLDSNDQFEVFEAEAQQVDPNKVRILRDVMWRGGEAPLQLTGKLAGVGEAFPLRWEFQSTSMETERVPEAIRMR